MPEKSAITFLILACVIISWPFRMPPSSRPMMTSTMAISTSVKPFCVCTVFMLVSPGVRPRCLSNRNKRASENRLKACLNRPLAALQCRKSDKCVGPLTLFHCRRAEPRLELLKPLAQEAQLVRVANLLALEQAAEHDPGGLEL